MMIIDKIFSIFRRVEQEKTQINNDNYYHEVLFDKPSRTKYIDLTDHTKCLRVGDIIWAKRYDNEEEKREILLNHTEGPYVVVGKVKNKAICIYGTGSYTNGTRQKISLSDSNYNLTKETKFLLNNVFEIDDTRFIKKLDKLNSIDLKYILKKIEIYKKLDMYDIDVGFVFHYPYEPGDIIIKNNKLYLIISKGVESFKCLCLNKNSGFNKFNNNGIIYYVDYDKEYEIPINLVNKRLDVLKSNLFVTVLNKYTNYKNSKELKVAKRGAMINYGGKLYYIYTEEGDFLIGYEIKNSKSNKCEKIKISNNQYYIDFSSSNKILKSNKYEILSFASDDEIDNIKFKKKNKKKDQKNVKKKGCDYKGFSDGTIVQTKTLSQEKHLILSRDDDYLYTLNLDEYDSGKISLGYHNLSEFRYVTRIDDNYYGDILYSLLNSDSCQNNKKILKIYSAKTLKR